MAFTPLHDRVLVRRIEGEEKTAGGLIIPDSAKEKPAEGEIMAVGAGARDEDGDRIAMDVKVGDKAVELHEVGPAHTGGDVIAYVPGDKTVFTGDILFIDGTPIMWAGPVSNWIRACEKIIGMDADVIVPGHGPITDKAGVRRVADYLAYIDTEARKRFDAGLSVRDAAHDIALGDFSSWGDAERIAVNVDTLYREYRGDGQVTPVMELFGLMAEMRDVQRAR